MPRKKSKKQLHLEEEANFVPYITEEDEDHWLYHVTPFLSVVVRKKPRALSEFNLTPLLKVMHFLDQYK